MHGAGLFSTSATVLSVLGANWGMHRLYHRLACQLTGMDILDYTRALAKNITTLEVDIVNNAARDDHVEQTDESARRPRRELVLLAVLRRSPISRIANASAMDTGLVHGYSLPSITDMAKPSVYSSPVSVASASGAVLQNSHFSLDADYSKMALALQSFDSKSLVPSLVAF